MRACVCVRSRVCVNLRGSSFFRHSGVLPAAPHRLQRRPGVVEPARLSSLQGVSSPHPTSRVCPTPAPPSPIPQPPAPEIHRRRRRSSSSSSTTPPPPLLRKTEQIRDPSMPQRQLGIRLSSPKVTAGAAAAGFPRPREHGDSTE